MKHICIPERGYVDIDRATWLALEGSRDFRLLHTRKILSVSYRPDGAVRLNGACYVGHAVCGGVLIEFSEKVQGALAALLSFASRNSFKVAKVDAAASEFSGLVVLLIDQFLDAVASYVASGRKFTYGRECAVGSLVGGKLDVVKSIRLRARGLGHLLAFERNATTYRTPLNKIILVALSELERLKTLIEIPLATISKSRGLSMIFADCRDFEVLHRERTYFAAEAMRLADVEDNELIRDISSLAGLILSRQSFDGVARPFPSSPRTWFLNLENLFERAVRNLLAGICVNARVTRGGKSPLAIFDVERNEYRANPDIVVVSPSEHIAVGDVKYKVFDGSAEAGDVYQLLVHAEAFGASKAFLIFPSDSFTCRTLGASRQGIDTFFFGVRLTYLADDLRKVADFLSLCCQADEPTEDDASELTKAANEETHEV